MDLAAFLKARLDEDEAYLRELTEIGEHKRDAMSEADIAANMPAFQELMTDPGVLRIMQRQVALGYAPPNDVSRLLHEVEAKRAVLAAYERQFAERKSHPGDLAVSSALLALHGVVKALAIVYSDHPAYAPAWATPQQPSPGGTEPSPSSPQP